MSDQPLLGRVALVAGATRGAGRAMAIELGRAGATVYATGRSTRAGRSPMNRPETVEQTAELVTAAGGKGIAVCVDHSVPEQVQQLFDRIRDEQSGRLDVLVNDVWGGDPLAQWGVPFWQHRLDNGLQLYRQGVETHIITSWFAAPLLVQNSGGLVVEITDGVDPAYRGSLFYDMAKAGVIRLALGSSADLRPHGVTVVALTPGRCAKCGALIAHYAGGEPQLQQRVGEGRQRVTGWSKHRLAGRPAAGPVMDLERWQQTCLSERRLAAATRAGDE